MQAEPWRAVYSTRAWRTVREAARRRAGDRCQWMSDGVRCPVVHDVEVHHREPLREGSDPFDQWGLVVLCHEHHAAAERLG
jgi:hypothetical protein